MGACLSKPTAKVSPSATKYQSNKKKAVKIQSTKSTKVKPDPPKSKKKIDDHSNSDWSIYLDELRNPYFFNLITGDSQWTIPPEIANWAEFKNSGYITAIITIPSEGEPGKEFTVEVYSQVIGVSCPSDCKPGDEIDLHFPLHVEIVPVDDKDVFIDSSIAWAALAKASGEDYSLIERNVSIAKEVLKEVSGGCYLDTLIFQLTWSYRLAQLETAVKDCYKKNGDFKDSSAYDNCKGVRRYDKGGLIEWWDDLKAQRELLEKKIESKEREKIFGDNSLFHDDTTKHHALEESMLTGDANAILKGLLDRKKIVETELDNDVARVLAIVSIEGPPPPPTRESMDIVHDYFLELVQSNVDMSEIGEEIEEFVGCAFEPRHKFCVEILLSMALLEFELESLMKQIDGLTPQPNDKKENTTNTTTTAESEKPNEAVQKLIDSQHLAANQLKEQLLAKKDKKRKSLMERLEQRKIKRVAQLVKEGMSQEAAEQQVQAENEAEILETMNKFDDDANEAVKKLNKEALQDLVGLAEEETKRLNDELNFTKDQKLKSLQDRLNKRKADKKTELEASGNPDTLEKDIELANLELENEAEKEKLEIENEFLSQGQKQRDTILNELVAQHEIESQRLEDELMHAADRNKKALKSRLNQRLQKKAAEILQQEKETGNNITIAESLALAQTVCSQEESESFAKLDEDLQKSITESQNTITSSLTELHNRELKKLQAEMAHKEELTKNSLQSRLERRKKATEIAIENTQDEIKKEELKQEIVAEEIKTNQELSSIAEELKNKQLADQAILQEKLISKQSEGQKNMKDRLAKRKENKEINNKKATENLISIDDIILKLKSEQKDQLKRLRDLIDYEKKIVTRGKQTKDKTKLLLQYSIMTESMIDGYKKRSLYHQKAIKSNASSPSITLEESIKLQTKELIKIAIQSALEQMILRTIRDVCGLIDVQYADKISTIQKMKENGASKVKLSEIEIKIEEGNRADLVTDFQKNLFSILALNTNVDDLMDITGESSTKVIMNKQSSDLELDDDDDTLTFGGNIKLWFNESQQLTSMYTDSLTSLCEYLEDADRMLLSESSDYYDMSQDIKNKLIKAMLITIINSFTENATLSNIKYTITNIEQSITKVSNTQKQSIDDIFSKTSNPIIINAYKKYLNEWINHPILTEEEVSKKKTTNTTIMLSSKSSRHINKSDEREKELLLSLNNKIDKKKKEIERTLDGNDKEKAITQLDIGYNNIKNLISKMPELKLNDINADGLVSAVEKSGSGIDINIDDLDNIQKEVEKTLAAKDTEKLMQQQIDSAANLDIAMKVKRAKDQQSLQERLLKRKKKD